MTCWGPATATGSWHDTIVLKQWPRGALALALLLVLLASGHSAYRPGPLENPVTPYRYSLLNWEVSNFLDKWARKSWDLLPWNGQPDRETRNALVREFFSLGQEQRELERRIRFSSPSNSDMTPEDASSSRATVSQIAERRGEILPLVEEAVEAEISAVLAAEGFSSRIGLIFPPVDTVFASSPGVLILSPRDRIHRQETLLLRPGMGDAKKAEIEGEYLRKRDLAALVERTGGVAVYPSVVSDSGGLRHSVVTAAHEWLHHWFFLQPLGQHFWDSPDMTTLNETAATIGGQELGDRAYSAIIGEPMAPDTQRTQAPSPSGFDFREEMRETRLHTEDLLGRGEIEEAEAYMEERRLMFAAHGYFIRKINQAYFAFHGSYATSPASVSPVLGQLRELRQRSASLGQFLHTVAQFGSYEEFQAHVRGAGGKS